MFRTVAVRGPNFIQTTLQKSVRTNAIRNIGFECVKRKHCRTSSLLLSDNSNTKQQKWHNPSMTIIRHYADLPSHQKVTLPALSPTMDSGTIISWSKKEGDKLNEGDVLAEIETDKATMAFETPEEGYLAKILVPAGTKDIPVGKLVCIIVENKDDVEKFKDYKDDGSSAPPPQAAPPKESPPPPATPAPAAPTPPPAPPAAAAAPSSDRVKASPMAKRLAEIQNIRLQGKGTGLYDSITSADVQAMGGGAGAAAAPPSASARQPIRPAPGQTHIDIPLTSMRSTIAKRLVQSKSTIPHYYLSLDVNIDNLMRTRAAANKILEKQKLKLSLNDFIIKAMSVASQRVPEVNAQWKDTFVRQFSNVDIAVAVATDSGLITPIVFAAQVKTVSEISQEVKVLAAKARTNKLTPQEFQGGTITVSNLGMFNIQTMSSIINPPQSAILAVGAATKRLVVDPSSPKGFKESSFLTLTFSGDHRVIDGATGAIWLNELKLSLEEPGTMVM